MEDHDFKTVRKNLNILSILILLLAYSQAQISDLSLLGIKLHVDGPKLYTGIYLVYVYFIWRFFTKLSFRGEKGFLEHFDQYFMSSAQGLRKEWSLSENESFFRDKSAMLKGYSTDDLKRYFVCYNVTRFKAGIRGLKRPRLILRFSKKDQSNDRPNENQFDVIADIQVSSSYILGKMLRFCIRTDKFGDYLFPIIPVLANILFIFLSRDWTGSFWSIAGWERPW